jgi:hypothetical protein
MKYFLLLVVAAIYLSSCTKELSLEGQVPEFPTKPDTVPVNDPFAHGKKYQLKAFYSDIPIDFDETDNEVKHETDLWPYVQEYIKDDYNILLGNDSLVVFQNDIKMPGLSDEILYRNYSFSNSNNIQYMNFLTPAYGAAKYRLYEMNDDYFIIGLKWKDGARVFSRFERVD